MTLEDMLFELGQGKGWLLRKQHAWAARWALRRLESKQEDIDEAEEESEHYRELYETEEKARADTLAVLQDTNRKLAAEKELVTLLKGNIDNNARVMEKLRAKQGSSDSEMAKLMGELSREKLMRKAAEDDRLRTAEKYRRLTVDLQDTNIRLGFAEQQVKNMQAQTDRAREVLSSSDNYGVKIAT